MLSSFLLENLACPTCQAHPLKVRNDSLACPICSGVFPICDGICYLLPDYSQVALSVSQAEVERLKEDRNGIIRKVSNSDESIGRIYGFLIA